MCCSNLTPQCCGRLKPLVRLMIVAVAMIACQQHPLLDNNNCVKPSSVNYKPNCFFCVMFYSSFLFVVMICNDDSFSWISSIIHPCISLSHTSFIYSNILHLWPIYIHHHDLSLEQLVCIKSFSLCLFYH